MNLIFKIVNYSPETNQIEVKFCRQNAPKSIDEYHSSMIDCKNLDFSGREQFTRSLMKYGLNQILEQEKEEVTLDSNKVTEELTSTKLEDNLNKVVSMNVKELLDNHPTYRMKKIEL